MPEYLAPGVFIEEIERGPRPIEASRPAPPPSSAKPSAARRGRGWSPASTSTAATSAAPSATANTCPMPLSGFFDNGGRRAYVCRIVGADAAAAPARSAASRSTPSAPGAWGNRVFVKLGEAARRPRARTTMPVGFRLQVAYWETPRRTAHYPDPFDPTQHGTCRGHADRGFRRPRLRRSDLARLLREAA